MSATSRTCNLLASIRLWLRVNESMPSRACTHKRGHGRMSALEANRIRRDGGNDVNDPERSLGPLTISALERHQFGDP
jgi:hypothetical protein